MLFFLFISEREGISINIDRFEANTDVGSGELTESGISIPCLVKQIPQASE